MPRLERYLSEPPQPDFEANAREDYIHHTDEVAGSNPACCTKRIPPSCASCSGSSVGRARKPSSLPLSPHFLLVTAHVTLRPTVPLQPLSAYQAAHSSMTWQPARTALVAHHPRIRWRVTREVADADIGFGLDRNERLADAGICVAEADTREFAKNLVEALADDLSIRDLKCLVDAFSQELAEQQAQRECRLARQD